MDYIQVNMSSQHWSNDNWDYLKCQIKQITIIIKLFKTFLDFSRPEI